MPGSNQERILALDVRPKSIGFAVIEGQTRMLDWGVKRFPGGVSAVLVPPGPKVAALILEYDPDALVVKRPRRGQSERVLGEVKQAAKARRVSLHFISPKAVKQAFVGRNNKDQIASAIAEQFPELLPILPPKRKIWQNENYRMKIFDAAAIGIAYFRSKAGKNPFPTS